MKELTTYSLVETERKSQGPHSGSYLEFTFGENPETIIETLREDSRLNDVHEDELRTVVNTQINR
jgi:cell division control protein 6